jgi:two-component system nitrogen regulation sensor histidine kinase GlnL
MHRLVVTDNGPGVPLDVEPKLFRKVVTGKTGGWGYGLYYAHLLVTSCQGEIRYTRDGQYTAFTVQLPDAKG